MVTTEKPILKPNTDDLKLFPNPTRDFITVEFSNTEPNKAADIVILNAQGRLVLQKKNTQQGLVQQGIDIGHLAAGTYFVKVKIRHDVRTEQFVKI